MATQDAAAPPDQPQQKRIHSLVVDTGPLIKNEPATSTLISQAEKLYTIPCVLDEIKDAATRSRVQTTLLPFLTLRNPRPASIKFITDFARRTGDLEVLSKPDIQLLALTYELELERNGGDWRVRNTPNQQTLNGQPPSKAGDGEQTEASTTQEIPETSLDATTPAEDVSIGPSLDATPPAEDVPSESSSNATPPAEDVPSESSSNATPPAEDVPTEPSTITRVQSLEPVEDQAVNQEEARIEFKLEELTLDSSSSVEEPREEDGDTTSIPVEEDSDDDDGEGWITPSNLKKQQAKDASAAGPKGTSIHGSLQAALLTSDFAMQNVALRINLNLVSPSGLARIRHLKTWVLRCHGCFTVSKKMDRQFCPKCGHATLTRVSCSTDTSGKMQLHLSKNFVYHKRGNVYSIPKPTHGSANGKLANTKGGGKNHWGANLILAEDQKEYTRKQDEDRRARQRDMMDEDYLPNLFNGHRTGGNGKIKIGAGRNINAKKAR